MCGRFVAATHPDQLAIAFGVDERQTAPLSPSWNVAPTMPVYAVAEHADRRHLVSFRWGLVPSWADDPRIGSRMINARRESVADKPAYRTALRRRRCLIPADGFYEWRRTEQANTPYFIHRADDRPLAFAGLWESWRQPDGTWLRTCTIVTGDAHPGIAQLHPRMPLALPERAWDQWLDRDERRPEAVLALLDRPAADDFVWHPVGTHVNSVRNDHAGLVAAIDGAPTSGQRRLDQVAHSETST
jgi:putative SOS response-associated peptidase YedK